MSNILEFPHFEDDDFDVWVCDCTHYQFYILPSGDIKCPGCGIIQQFPYEIHE